MIVPAMRPFENVLIAELIEADRQADIVRQREIWRALGDSPLDMTAELSTATIEKALLLKMS